MNELNIVSAILSRLTGQLADQLLSAEQHGELPQLSPGQRVLARVLDTTTSGATILDINGSRISIRVPFTLRSGEPVSLTFISSEPRLTFSLSRQSSGPPVSVSGVGRWLAALSTATQENTVSASLPRLSRILDSMPQDTGQLADRLQEVLSRSGLFYESHLRDWACGTRQRADLLREPQGSLSTCLADPDCQSSHLNERHAVSSSEVAEDSSFADPRTSPLIREQLSAMLSSEVVWHGEAWPGQELEWRVHEREAEQEMAGGTQQAWETTLKLHLPVLGTVEATLRLVGRGATVTIFTDEPASAAKLRSETDMLTAALSGVGLEVDKLEVNSAAERS